MSYSLPANDLLQRQAEWLSEARGRLLRLAEIGRRKSILDLGAGYGIISSELKRRSDASVFALDLSLEALRVAPVPAVCADAARLPFPNSTFDLVFSQNLMLWVHSITDVATMTFRALKPGGIWVLLEPDFGGMIEYPPEIETRDLWIAALQRAKGDPFAGRKLSGALTDAGFQTRVELLPRLYEPDPRRFDFLQELPLTVTEISQLEEIRSKSSSHDLAHLPYFLILAERF